MFLRRLIAPILIGLLAGCSQVPGTDPELAKWDSLRARMRTLRKTPCCTQPTTDPATHVELLAATRKVRSSVVRVVADVDSRVPTARTPGGATPAAHESGGSGVILSSGGMVLTNEHVIRGAARLTVILSDGRRLPVLDSRCCPRADLAILWIAAPAPLAALTPAHRVRPGDPVVAIGATGATARSDRAGTITRTQVSLQHELDPAGRRDYGNLIESTAAIEPGFSGGPLLNAAGELVGISVATASGQNGRPRAYAIPVDEATLATIGMLGTSLATAR